RIRLTTDCGDDVLLDLPKAVAMADGDGLCLEDGTWLRVRAAVELLVEVRHQDPTQFMRLAWHLGNRHLPIEIQSDRLRIPPPHVIERMLHAIGAQLVVVQGPFQPESGAYGHGNSERYDDREYRRER